MKPRTTLVQIAKKAGVHVTTVSMALRNHPSLPQTTKLRLQRLAAEMDYKVDPMLTALSQYRTKLRQKPAALQIIYLNLRPEPQSWKKKHSHAAFYDGARKRALELGLSLEHCFFYQEGMSAARWNRIFRARGVNGLILSPSLFCREHMQLEWDEHCWVQIETDRGSQSVHTVSNDQIQCVQAAVRKARELGYRRIGLAISEQECEATNHFWASGFHTEMTLFRRKDQIPICTPSEWTEMTFLEWFFRHQPDLVLGCHTEILGWLANAGIAVPQDVGFINLDIKSTDGEHAGILQDHLGVGATAVDILTRLIQQNEIGLPARCTSTLLRGAWVNGSTVQEKMASERRAQTDSQGMADTLPNGKVSP